MHIAVADGSVRRVCQLTGEWDRARRTRPTASAQPDRVKDRIGRYRLGLVVLRW